MIKTIAEVYRTSWRFMLAFPALVAIPVGIEFIQHVIEIRGGMYVDRAGVLAAENDPLRLAWGMVKTLAVTAVVYWMARYMAGFDRGRVGAIEPVPARLFVWVLLFQAAVTALSLWGGGLLRGLGAPEPMLMPVGITYALGLLFLGILLEPWKAAAALGNPSIGWSRSIRMMAPILPWSLAFVLVMMLPLMAVHYALAILAIGLPAAAVWALMIADSVVVGYLACVLAATTFIVARRAAERRGVALQA